MEAKDTVIGKNKREEVRLARYKRVGLQISGYDVTTDCLELQAEISFKAGRGAEREWALSNTYRNVPLEESLKKAGIKEVVEFLHLKLCDEFWLFNTDEWQAKKKGWGI